MGRYAAREDEIDRMLRAGLFVDLYGVVRQGVRVGVERYSIKDLEPVFAYERAIDLREASRNLHALERALELGESETLPPEVRTAVEQYNRDDCVATHGLREWLEQLRAEQIAQGRKIARPDIEDGAPSESVGDRAQRAAALAARLLRDVPAETSARDASEQGRWILAHLLEWHRREA